MGRARRIVRGTRELTEAQIDAITLATTDDTTWSANDRVLLRLCDALHHDCTIDDALWQALKSDFSDEAILELLMLAGFYRTVSYLTNALKLPLEPYAARFSTGRATSPTP